jgi:hypothetical protein
VYMRMGEYARIIRKYRPIFELWNGLIWHRNSS